MASLPKSGTVTYEEWPGMPVVNEGREGVVNGKIRIMPPNNSAQVRMVVGLVAALQRQPRHFPNVQVRLDEIWPD